MFPVLLKCTFIPGIRSHVLDEIARHPGLRVIEAGNQEVYLEYTSTAALKLRDLRSVLNIFVVRQDEKLHTQYISNHKSVLGELIEVVLQSSKDKFTTFRLSCAGSDSPEVQSIEHYIVEHFKMAKSDDADLEVYIGKDEDVWEVGARLAARPLSLRPYRVANIPGGMNPTIAYAMNTLCGIRATPSLVPEKVGIENLQVTHFTRSYLNICSGSGTLLIEAGLMDPTLKLVGFDINGKTNALAVENIKKAGLIKSIQLKTASVFGKPDLGTFDIIVSDLPFGMQISKGEDLRELYTAFVEYSENSLNANAILAVYTAEYELLQSILEQSELSITRTISLRVPTSVGAYMQTKIFVCKKK